MKRQKIDNRMQWVLKLEELEQAGETPIYFTEYEICSEVRIPGVFTYGDGMLECSLYQEADDNNLYTYILKIKHVEKVFDYDESNYSKDGYYFKEGLVGEIIALFSFYFQARFYLKATITGAMTPQSIRMRLEKKFLYKKINDDLTCLNLEMFSNHDRNWCKDNGLLNFLDSTKTVDEKHHQNLIRAVHWYSVAIKEIGVDHELFFIKMVSSIEALLDISKVESDNLEKKLTIEYKYPRKMDNCSLERQGGLCLAGIYRDWIRVYVPKGSKITKTDGLEFTETEDLTKTVFEGFFELRPEGSLKFELEYTVPLKADQQYKLLIQKQGGIKGHTYEIEAFGKKQKAFPLDTDKELIFRL